jgi:hypothetical protein
MKDFSFDGPATLSAGKQVVKVVNQGPQLHEWNVMKLAPCKTPEDIGKFFASPSGPPPFASLGGLNGVQKDGVGFVNLDLTPGNYVAICNIPDPRIGQAALRARYGASLHGSVAQPKAAAGGIPR